MNGRDERGRFTPGSPEASRCFWLAMQATVAREAVDGQGRIIPEKAFLIKRWFLKRAGAQLDPEEDDGLPF